MYCGIIELWRRTKRKLIFKVIVMQVKGVKKTVYHVDKLSLYYLLHHVVQKYDVTLCSNQPFP